MLWFMGSQRVRTRLSELTELMSSLEKCLFKSSASFWIGFFLFFFFLILSCVSGLYVLEINSLSVTSFADIFSHSVACLFDL